MVILAIIRVGRLDVELQEVERDLGADRLRNEVDALAIGRIGVRVERGSDDSGGRGVLTTTN